MSKHWQEGSLVLRKGKRRTVWYGTYRVPKVKDGQIKWVQVKQALGTLEELKTEKAARRKLDGILQDINSPDYRVRPDITFKEFSDKWKESVLPQLKGSTQEVYRSCLTKHLVPYFGAVKLSDFNGMIVQEYVTKHTAHPLTVRNIITTMRSIWGSAKDFGYTAADPFAGVRLPRIGKRTEQPSFTEEQMRLIIQSADEAYRTFFWLAAETGLRVGELCGLRAEDVIGETVCVQQSVWRGKEQSPKTQNSVRQLQISPMLAEALHKRALTGLLFHSTKNTPWKASDVLTRHLHPILEKLGVPKCGFHAFRHGNASIMDRMNTPLKTRQKRLGHGSAVLTMDRYTHSVSEDDRRVAEEIGRRLQ